MNTSLLIEEASCIGRLSVAAFRSRLPLTFVFLVVAYPYLVWKAIRVRLDRKPPPAVSPFIYTMQ